MSVAVNYIGWSRSLLALILTLNLDSDYATLNAAAFRRYWANMRKPSFTDFWSTEMRLVPSPKLSLQNPVNPQFSIPLSVPVSQPSFVDYGPTCRRSLPIRPSPLLRNVPVANVSLISSFNRSTRRLCNPSSSSAWDGCAPAQQQFLVLYFCAAEENA